MVKRTKKSATTPRRKKKAPVRARRIRMRPDPYVRLLTNPCTGPLVHGPGSSEGGQVVRFESDFILGNGATNTAGFLHWIPGAYNNSTSIFGKGLLTAVGADDVTALTITDASTLAPGYSFLATNASSYRCLAACLQVYWPGSELNRAGIVSAAQGTYGLLSTAVPTYKASDIRSLSPVVERMPTDYMEVKWAPNFSDGLFRRPGSNNPPEDGHGSLLMSFAGIPVSTGIRVRLVAVYEWRPITTGLVLASNTSQGSAGDIQAIRRDLDARDSNWWNKTGQAAYEFLSGMVVGYSARKPPGMPRIELR